MFDPNLVDKFNKCDFFSNDEIYVFFEKCGSLTNWQSPIIERIFNLDLHRYEQVYSYKEHLYRDYVIQRKNILKVFFPSDTCLPIHEFDICSINLKIKYNVFIQKDYKLCFCIWIDNSFLENMRGRKLEFVFTDNNTKSSIRERTISLQYDNNNNILVSSELIKVDKSIYFQNRCNQIINISFDLSDLDMDWRTANNYIAFNMICSRRLAEYAYTDLVYLSGDIIPMYLYLSENIKLS